MLGKGGLRPEGQTKKEGDGTTPPGTFGIRQVYFRPDRVARPMTELPIIPTQPHDLWCDDPGHPLYNRPVTAPFAASHEKMWRESRVYDYCLVLDYNLNRPARGEGSAIFFHQTREDESPPPTEGCIAIHPNAMVEILPFLRIGSTMTIKAA